MKNVQIAYQARQVLRTAFVELTLVLPLVALAQTGGDQDAVIKACGGDLRQNCVGVKPVGGRMVACMQEHLAALRTCASEKKGQLDAECRALVAQ